MKQVEITGTFWICLWLVLLSFGLTDIRDAINNLTKEIHSTTHYIPPTPNGEAK